MTDERKIALLTMIEVALLEGSYKTLGMAVAAHALLSGKTIAEAEKELGELHWPDSLKKMYPDLVRKPTLSEDEWVKLTEGKPKPIAIWNKEDARAYYNATETQRQAWNMYAQREANKFQDTLGAYETIAGYTGRDRDGNITDWCPDLWFPEWLEKSGVK